MRGLGRRSPDYARRSGEASPPIYMGPNQATLLYDWTPTTDNVTLNGADAVSVLCRDRFYNSIPGLEFTQATAAKQALWNATDADLNSQPTLEFAGAEQYQTSAVVLPTQCTVVTVVKSENGATFGSIFEHSTSYSASNGGLIQYAATSINVGLHYTGQTIKTLAAPGTAFLWVTAFDLTLTGSAAIPIARVNNGAMGATGFNASAAGTFRSTALMLGGRAASTFWTGPWARTRVYSGVFTSAQADAEYTYQQARFGLP